MDPLLTSYLISFPNDVNLRTQLQRGTHRLHYYVVDGQFDTVNLELFPQGQ